RCVSMREFLQEDAPERAQNGLTEKLSSRLTREQALSHEKPSVAWPVGSSKLFGAGSLPRCNARQPPTDIPPVLPIAVSEALLQTWLLHMDHNQMVNQEHRRGKPKPEGRAVPQCHADQQDQGAHRHGVAEEPKRPGGHEFPGHEPLLAAERADPA